MDYLQGLQDAINKQDPQAIAANTQVNDAVNTLRAEMNTAGITTEPGSPEEKKQAHLESGLRDQLIAAQMAKNGTPLTPEEAKNLAMGYSADHVLNGNGDVRRIDGENKSVVGRFLESAPKELERVFGKDNVATAAKAIRWYALAHQVLTGGGQASRGSLPFDKAAATENILANAEDHFTGYCAHHVFDALIAGLPEDYRKLFERTRYAKDAGPSLEKIGFKKVLTSTDQLATFIPQDGDVVVLQDYPGQKCKGKDGKKHDCPAGHIAMFAKGNWVSDKVQDNSGSGIWAGPSFKKANVPVAIYRWD